MSFGRSGTQSQTFKHDLISGKILLDYEKAIAIAVEVSEQAPNYPQVQQKLAQWSNKIIEQATEHYNGGDIKSALAELDLIPKESTEVKKIANTKAQEWKENDSKNKELYAQAQTALDAKNWSKAIEEAKKISGSTDWKEKAGKIITKAEQEIASAAKPKTVAPPPRNTGKSNTGRSSGSSTGRKSGGTKASPVKPSKTVVDVCSQASILCN